MMGWRLAEEVLSTCPDLKYREFRVLMAFALSARDATRRGWPGEEALAARANCTDRTARRAMASLQQQGIIKQVSRQAPGRRAVYELVLTPDSMLSGEHRTETSGTPDSMLSSLPSVLPSVLPSRCAPPQSPLRDDHDGPEHVADDRDGSHSGADRNQTAGPYARTAPW